MRSRWFVAVVLACASAVAAAGPVNAAATDIDHLALGSLAKGHVSYGRSGSAATAEWEKWTSAPGMWRADTYGNIGAVGPNPTTLCARLKVQFLDSKARVLAVRVSNSTQMVCLPPNTGGNGRGISPPIYYDSTKVRKVRVMLQRAGSQSGPWTTVAQKSCALRTDDCP
jgi:hypothetical protein